MCSPIYTGDQMLLSYGPYNSLPYCCLLVITLACLICLVQRDVQDVEVTKGLNLRSLYGCKIRLTVTRNFDSRDKSKRLVKG